MGAFVRSAVGSSAGFLTTVSTAAFGSTPTGGNSIVVGITTTANGPDSGLTITDTARNTYKRIGYWNSGSSSHPSMEIWISRGIVAIASTVVTATDTGSNLGSIIAYEISGLPVKGVILDVFKGGYGGGGSLTTGSATAKSSTGIIVAFGALTTATAGTWTLGAGYSNLAVTNGTGGGVTMAGETQVISAAGSYTATLSQTEVLQNYCIVMAVFSDADLSPNRVIRNTLRPAIFTPGLAR
jgi:hypothetical protein